MRRYTLSMVNCQWRQLKIEFLLQIYHCVKCLSIYHQFFQFWTVLYKIGGNVVARKPFKRFIVSNSKSWSALINFRTKLCVPWKYISKVFSFARATWLIFDSSKTLLHITSSRHKFSKCGIFDNNVMIWEISHFPIVAIVRLLVLGKLTVSIILSET